MEFKYSSIKWRLDQLIEHYDIEPSGLLMDFEKEIKLYYDRYETMSNLSVPEYSRILKRNIRGENFNDIIDKL